eukprot:TRINITY_DN14241_c0_g1_i3.p1 TRINITY_DN14241_c0_g1~~TRINITY_DN14241_c0_g1_i3.p1  ORF type:complete len:737 (-),score=161.04 TRINITY_DN14241_c0_g1_i3:247-2457(-)
MAHFGKTLSIGTVHERAMRGRGHFGGFSGGKAPSLGQSLHESTFGRVSKKLTGCESTNSLASAKSEQVIREDMRWLKRRAMSASLDQTHGRRKRIIEKVHGVPYQVAVAVLITVDICLLVIEVDFKAAGQREEADWLRRPQQGLLGLFVLDLLLRWWAYRCLFYKSFGNWLDLLTVLYGFYDELSFFLPQTLPMAGPMKAFRFLRVARVLRSVTQLHDLYLLMMGIMQSIRALVFASILIFVVLTMFSVLAVELLQDTNVVLYEEGAYGDCLHCDQAFQSVMKANLTFMQTLVAGDGWGVIAWPLIARSPAAAVVMVSSVIIVNVGLMNTVAAVLVDRQAQAREHDQDYMDLVMAEELLKSYVDLQHLFEQMDTDETGSTDLDKMMKHYDDVPEFKAILNRMDIHKNDLPIVFDIIDVDDSGDLQFGEFVSGLHALKSENAHTLLVFIKYYTSKLFQGMKSSTELRELILDLQHRIEKQDDTLHAAVAALRTPGIRGAFTHEHEANGFDAPCEQLHASNGHSAVEEKLLQDVPQKLVDTIWPSKGWSEHQWCELAIDMQGSLLTEEKVYTTQTVRRDEARRKSPRGAAEATATTTAATASSTAAATTADVDTDESAIGHAPSTAAAIGAVPSIGIISTNRKLPYKQYSAVDLESVCLGAGQWVPIVAPSALAAGKKGMAPSSPREPGRAVAREQSSRQAEAVREEALCVQNTPSVAGSPEMDPIPEIPIPHRRRSC